MDLITIFKKMPDEMAPDESRSSGNKDLTHA
jgi:hypothetical protein